MPPDKVKVVYLGVPLEEFSRPRIGGGDSPARARSWASRPDEFAIGTVTRLHDSKGNSYLVDAARLVLDQRPHARFFIVGEGPLREPISKQQARALGLGDRFVFAGLRAGRRARRLGVRRQRLSVAVGRHAAHRVRGAGDGEADRRDRRRRPARRAHARARRDHRAEARRARRWPTASSG